ncbi:MAG TPA: pyrimidine reductase family protein [Actinomycetes bacterium]|nr:pyrimidine reductase family protein [Actinomycetes bacterium]
MRRLLPLPLADELDVDALAEHYAYPDDRAVLRANMVTSVDGAVTLGGRSKPISGDADWYLFGLQRALADVIVVGAGTARAEGYGPGRSRPEFAHLRERKDQASAPTLALVTRKGDLDPDAGYLGGTARPIVITGTAGFHNLGEVAERADVIVAGDDDLDLKVALEQLHERGHRRVLCEGGPHLLGTLLDADLIDELAASLSPIVVGGDAGRMVQGAKGKLHSFSLDGVLEADGALFMHYRRKRSGS